jgi:hypothetical protein
MSSKFVAGACAIALAGAWGAVAAASETGGEARPTVVRVSVPLPFEMDRGSASFASSLGGTRRRVAAFCGGPSGHARLSLVVVSEPEPEPEPEPSTGE